MMVAASSALFLALEVHTSLADRLLRLQRHVSNPHWVARAALHVTIRYLRIIENHAELIERLAGVKARPFDMKVSGVGHFDLLDGAVALWAGVEHVPEMWNLHIALDRIALEMGSLPPSRPWRPHISLGFRSQMHPSVTQWTHDLRDLDLPAAGVIGFGLYTSRKLPGTGGYERLAWFPLQTAVAGDPLSSAPEMADFASGTGAEQQARGTS
jgi:RNA 2',3'-cyclic 3'-phosphodiesterase